jgi:hypothetical protein
MPSYPESQLAVIDARVAAGQTRTTKMGTVASRSPGVVTGSSLYAVNVVMDGSSGTAQPVKCFESVIVEAGDRVGLVRFESDWIIVGNYTLRTLGDASISQTHAISTSTSATFVDMPSSPSVVLPEKYRDNTLLRITVSHSMYIGTAAGPVEIGVYVLSFDGTVSYDQVVMRRYLNDINSHHSMTSWVDTAALAGGQSYAFTARWRRVSGTGVMSVDGNDSIAIRVQEVAP